MAVLLWVLSGVCLVVALMAVRLLVVLRSGPRCKPGEKGPVSVLAIAGSGGHTTEMLRLMESLSASYSPRHYVIADTDHMSEEKIRTLEAAKNTMDLQQNFTIHRIPRSREVRQAWSSSVLTTANALFYSVPLVFKLRPDMVLSNGPGTCVPLCVAALLLGFLGLKKVLIIYVESICRVENLSLTGKILYHLSDYFFVQWSTLKDKYPRSIYIGRTV